MRDHAHARDRIETTEVTTVAPPEIAVPGKATLVEDDTHDETVVVAAPGPAALAPLAGATPETLPGALREAGAAIRDSALASRGALATRYRVQRAAPPPRPRPPMILGFPLGGAGSNASRSLPERPMSRPMAPPPLQLPALESVERALAAPQPPPRDPALAAAIQGKLAATTSRAAELQARTDAQLAGAAARSSELRTARRERHEAAVLDVHQRWSADAEARLASATAGARGGAEQATGSDTPGPTAGDEGGFGPQEPPPTPQAQTDTLVASLLDAGRRQRAAARATASADLARMIVTQDEALDLHLETALSAFPNIARYYETEIQALEDELADDLAATDDPAEEQALIDAAAAQLAIMLEDIAQIARFNSDDPAASRLALGDAFGISFEDDQPDDDQSFSAAAQEATLLGAVLTEGAFRREGGEQFAGTAFGGVFQELFGEVAFWERRGEHPTAGAQVVGHGVDVYRNIASDLNFTSYMDNMIHELGHVFDNRTHRHGRIDVAQAFRTGALDRGDTAGAMERQSGDLGPEEMFADLFLNWVNGSFHDTEAGAAAGQWTGDAIAGPSGPTGDEWPEQNLADLASQRTERWFHGELTHTIAAGETPGWIANYYDVPLAAITAAMAEEHDGGFPAGGALTIPSNLDERPAEPESDHQAD